MEAKKGYITINCDEKLASDFSSACKIAGISEEFALEQCLKPFIYITYKTASECEKHISRKNNVNQLSFVEFEKNKLDYTFEHRINNLFRKHNTVANRIIDIYFNLANSDDTPITRAEMQTAFYLTNEKNNSKVDMFINAFRQLCTNNARAYGKVFEYCRNNDQVTLNHEYKDFIISSYIRSKNKYEND